MNMAAFDQKNENILAALNKRNSLLAIGFKYISCNSGYYVTLYFRNKDKEFICLEEWINADRFKELKPILGV